MMPKKNVMSRLDGGPFYVKRSNAVLGPISKLALHRQLSAGELRPGDLISESTEGPWEPVSVLLKNGARGEGWGVEFGVGGGFFLGGIVICIVGLIASAFTVVGGAVLIGVGVLVAVFTVASRSRRTSHNRGSHAESIINSLGGILSEFPVPAAAMLGILLPAIGTVVYLTGMTNLLIGGYGRTVRSEIKPDDGPGGFAFGERVFVYRVPASVDAHAGWSSRTPSEYVRYGGRFLGYEDTGMAVVLVDRMLGDSLPRVGESDGKFRVVVERAEIRLDGGRITLPAGSLTTDMELARGETDAVGGVPKSVMPEVYRTFGEYLASRVFEAWSKEEKLNSAAVEFPLMKPPAEVVAECVDFVRGSLSAVVDKVPDGGVVPESDIEEVLASERFSGDLRKLLLALRPPMSSSL